MKNCPFYGYSMFRPTGPGSLPFILIPQHGNQCSLIMNSHAPCMMETNGEPVEWSECPRVGDVRIGGRT
jgi:hypothetical protein